MPGVEPHSFDARWSVTKEEDDDGQKEKKEEIKRDTGRHGVASTHHLHSESVQNTIG